ncbi:YesL family protein [Fictibacillus phosphorivorans]|uniref:YesL family protein n=1 Tax=Fictibacillus phosphorivorans TaxID=1221500 RepID=UPI00203CF8FA|nr:DUF624 domain-containing protein [Fictibacillus phosphorivorans]MCM3717732.1 DUF624 domain-containing protein [Fictibacillus phosphorivorans]MCM3775632.1 DUF624 domain-containing protein [Fictibacillus phosphorivorans]
MEKIFSIEGKIFTTLARIFDLLTLNVLFIMSCLPIITIGAALTAMYTTTFKMARNEETSIALDYWNGFKHNFKQSTKIWLTIVMAAVTFLFAAQFFMGKGSAFLFPMLFVVTVSLLAFLYVFPLLAKFENSSFQTIKNAIFISFHSMAYSILLFAITLFFVGIIPIFLPKLLIIWLFLGCSLSAYVKSFLFERLFNNYVAYKDEKEIT